MTTSIDWSYFGITMDPLPEPKQQDQVSRKDMQAMLSTCLADIARIQGVLAQIPDQPGSHGILLQLARAACARKQLCENLEKAAEILATEEEKEVVT